VLCVFAALIAPLRAAEMRGHSSMLQAAPSRRRQFTSTGGSPTEGPLNLPSVYPEWGKHALSDEHGNFVIENPG
jgi:hypothetical protein